MADGMGSAWRPDPSRREDKQYEAGRLLFRMVRTVIDMHTSRLVEEIDPSYIAEFKDGPYYNALDDLRELVDLPPISPKER